MRKLTCALFLITFAPSLVFAQNVGQQANQKATSSTQNNEQSSSLADLQKLVQDLLKQVQALTQQVAALKGELGKQQEAETRPSTTPIPETQAQASETQPPELTRSLARGSSGDDVRKLQEFLAKDKEVYPDGLITGYFGPLTEKAVKKWQEKHDIESVGIIGPKTLAKFQELGKGRVKELTQGGAGQSGVIPPGLLIAPGIQKKLELSTTTISQATTTPTAVTTTTPSGTIPATPATPATPAQPSSDSATSTVPAIPATPATPATSTSPTSPPPPVSASGYPTCGQVVKNVPSQYPTIQAAVNAASVGDTIRVAAGTYNEGLNMRSGICLEGAGIDQTVITNSNNAVIMVGVTSNASYVIIKNLTVRGGNNYIGTMPANGMGGGVFTFNTNDVLLQSCRLTQNNAYTGGGLYANHTRNLTVDHCIIDNNHATNMGGGIYIEPASTAKLTNVTVVGNSADARIGGVAYAWENGSSNLTVRNSILWSNSGPMGTYTTGSTDFGLYWLTPGQPSVSYSDISGWSGGTGNISADPRFVGATDYHLQSNSPAINSGDPSSQYNDPDGTRNDMGAYPTTFSASVTATSTTATSATSSTATSTAATSTVTLPPTPTNVQAVTTSGSQSQPPQIWYYLTFNYTLQSTTQSFNVYRKRPTDASFVKYTYGAQTSVNPSILPLPASDGSNLYHRDVNQWQWWTTLPAPVPDTASGEYKFYVTAVDTSGVESVSSETKSFKLYAAPVIASPADGSTISAPFSITVTGDSSALSPTYGMALYKNVTGDTAWSAWPAPATSFTYPGTALNSNDNPHRLVVWFSSNAYDRSLFGVSTFNVTNATTSTSNVTGSKSLLASILTSLSETLGILLRLLQ